MLEIVSLGGWVALMFVGTGFWIFGAYHFFTNKNKSDILPLIGFYTLAWSIKWALVCWGISGFLFWVWCNAQ